jgi:sugar phosphate isomerase/epimerase
MQRRDFIKTLGAAAAAGLYARSAGAAPEGAAELKLGSQESRLPGKDLREKVLRLEEWGGVGLEIGGAPGHRVQEIKDAIAGTRVRVSALCWGSCNGDLVSADPERRKKGIAAMEDALKVAGELSSTGVIFVPCFHKQSDLPPAELDKVLLDILPGLGAAAQACGTRVLLEPLNKGETFYLNRLEQAARFCREVNHPGVAMMGDFYHMAKEEQSDSAAFETAGPWLHHVHLASRTRVLPGQDDRSFVDGFRGLKMIGYRDYCSFECGILKGTSPEEEIPKSFRLLEAQWKEAGA